jgi:hypothetical protein
MQLKEYLNDLLDAISACPYVESHSLAFEERPPTATYISGSVTFFDESMLLFKEFGMFLAKEVRIVKYGYNYLSKDNVVIFRYDNALDPLARDLSTYPTHKHQGNKVLPAVKPDFHSVIAEISSMIDIGSV